MSYKFLIYISYSYALPIGLPLESEIISRGYTVKWFSDLDNGKQALSHKNNVLQTIQEVVTYEPDIVLAATDDIPDFITGIKVQIFHGFLSYKRLETKNGEAHFRIRGFFDLYCTQGPSSTQGFKLQQKKHNHFEITETGWSKVDPLFPLETEQKNKIPTVLIATTFTKRLSLAYNETVYNEIKKISLEGNYRFLMVMHPKLPTEVKLKWQALNNDNFTYYNTTDLIPLFKKSDILFADTTSAIQEYLLQKKPVVTFNHTIKHNYLINITEANLIEASFKKALTYPADLIKNIDTFIKDLHPCFDGKSSQRVVTATIDFLHKNKDYLEAKPLNLIRKYKIRKRLHFFTLKSYNKPFTK